MKMKVLHSGDINVKSGGIAMSTYWTMFGLRQIGVDAELIMLDMPEGGQLRGEGVPVHYSKSPKSGFMRKFYCPSYKGDIKALGEYDLYHAQCVWIWSTYAIADVARQKNKPYLITPRGMLYPQDIAKNNAFYKKISLKWRLLDDLNKAACVHTTCKDEMMHCRNLGVNSPIAVIPNPVEIKDFDIKKSGDVFRLGYLGRLSRRKNVEGLIKAFATLGDKAKNVELLIIGGDDPKYEQYLKDEVVRLGLKNVVFAGFLSGVEKDKALASCSVLAMPSEFENLGNVVLEGLVREIPCIATTGSPWEELNTCKCGWWVEYSQDAITKAIEMAIDTPVEELKAMGKRGRKLVEDRYSVESVAKQMKRVYDWILGNGPQPECVYCL